MVLFNPANGTCFASFGAHPDFGVALERTVTELLQGRGLKDLDVFTPPTFDDEEVAEHTNLETHFIDSSGLIFLGPVQAGCRLSVCQLEFTQHHGRRVRHADGYLQKGR
ncbi:YcaO-like family protein [Escherichia coli]